MNKNKFFEFDGNRRRVERIKTVLSGLVLRHTAVPFPAMSDHYSPPEPPVEPTIVISRQPEVGVGYTERTTVEPVRAPQLPFSDFHSTASDPRHVPNAHTSPNFYL